MQPIATPEAPKVHLLLNRVKLDELRRAHGIKSDAELARRIGVTPETLWRVSRGNPPSNPFMARVKMAFPSAAMDSLFELREVA